MTISPDLVERAIVDALTAASPIEPTAITRSTRLLDIRMDSLTLVTVLSEVETAFGVTFDTDDLAELLGAREVGDLIATVARKLGSIG